VKEQSGFVPWESRWLYGCWPLKGAFSQPSEAKARTKAKASCCCLRCRSTGNSRENILPEFSKFYCHPGRAGGSPFWIRLSSSKFSANFYKVSPGYFRVARTRLVAGRAFTDSANAETPRVAIVNLTFAMRLFGTTNVVGQHLPWPGGQQEIVGVVEDGKYGTLTEDPTPAIFWPILQNPESDTVLLIRSDRPASEIIPLIRNAIAGVDSNLALFTLQRWSDALAMVTFPARAATIALGILGALATMLSITGIFGLAAYTVTRRMRELGIRVALGPHRMQVLRAALGRIALLLGLGSIAGLLLGAAASRLLASIVYGASAYDPPVIIAAVMTMMLIGLLSAALQGRAGRRRQKQVAAASVIGAV